MTPEQARDQETWNDMRNRVREYEQENAALVSRCDRLEAELARLRPLAEAGAQWKRELAELVGLRRLVAGEPIGVSTGIHEQTTYGYGQLDNNGYWEFPVSEVAADFARLIRNDKTELSRLRPLAAQWQQERDEARSDARHLRECLKACKRVAAEQTAAQDQEIARLRPLAAAGERLRMSATYAPVDPEDVADALGAVPAEAPAPSEKKEREIVMRWLQRRYEHYQAIQAANPWTSGNDGVHDDAEQRADALGHELALLEAEAPAPTKEE